MEKILNILTIDVEDYYMVSAFSDVIETDKWEDYSSRVEKNTMTVLDILENHEAKGTFFILGWVAERYPHMVKEIDRRGHEIACHSYQHKLIYNMTSIEFASDTKKAKAILEDILGKRIYGYRAPSYSITEKSLWAMEILREAGFLYDSSIFPIFHDRYGYPAFARFPTVLDTPSGRILEIPMSTISILNKNIPVGGGGYLRLFPLSLTEWAIKKINEKENKAAVVYFHPWEIDANQPRINGSYLSEARHYLNIKKMQSRIEHLLKNFAFGAIRDIFYEQIQSLEVNAPGIRNAI